MNLVVLFISTVRGEVLNNTCIEMCVCNFFGFVILLMVHTVKNSLIYKRQSMFIEIER